MDFENVSALHRENATKQSLGAWNKDQFSISNLRGNIHIIHTIKCICLMMVMQLTGCPRRMMRSPFAHFTIPFASNTYLLCCASVFPVATVSSCHNKKYNNL
jgi:hypothetical protein